MIKCNSYFKVGLHTFAFNDDDLDDTIRAYELAAAVGEPISVFRVPLNAGPWDRHGIVGYRRREQIVEDIRLETDEDALDSLRDELDELNVAYKTAGRQPPTVLHAVAA